MNVERINGQTVSRGRGKCFSLTKYIRKVDANQRAATNLLILANYREVAGAARESQAKVGRKLPTHFKKGDAVPKRSLQLGSGPRPWLLFAGVSRISDAPVPLSLQLAGSHSLVKIGPR